MKCGIRFCGGCNPRYDRGAALKALEEKFKSNVEFVIAEEEVYYDLLLVIGGCTNCCAAYEHFHTKNGVLKMWDQSQIEKIVDDISKVQI